MKPLSWFDALPLTERLFVRARAFSAPLAAMARRAPEAGRIADVGCGHGVLSAMLVSDHPRREVLGLDPDPRKIAWASASVGRAPNARFQVGSAHALPSRAFEAIAVADVLYLLPTAEWPAFLTDCRRALVPRGRLLLKEAEDDGGWRAWKCLAQEQLMVRLLRRTRSSGALILESREFTRGLLEACGFRVGEVVPMSHGYTTPHVLFVADSV